MSHSQVISSRNRPEELSKEAYLQQIELSIIVIKLNCYDRKKKLQHKDNKNSKFQSIISRFIKEAIVQPFYFFVPNPTWKNKEFPS